MFRLRAGWVSCVCAVVFFTSTAKGVNIDFSVEDDGVTPLANGQKIDVGQEFGVLFDVFSAGNNAGAAIFDSTPGVNAADPDLWVGLGNVLILQENNGSADVLVGDFFVTPNDDASSDGILRFDFFSPITAQSVDLVDINGNGPVTVRLTDTNNLVRTYFVPMHFTYDIATLGLPPGAKGFDTLDMTTLANQLGEGGGIVTAIEDAGFDAGGVIQLSFEFDGSGALDNLSFIPEPATGLLILGVAMALTRRRR